MNTLICSRYAFILLLQKAIENEGEEVPKSFDANKFNSIEDGNYFEIDIKVVEQDNLINFLYE
ncbi:hypothetical protein D3C76_336120 [compost metagenome]